MSPYDQTRQLVQILLKTVSPVTTEAIRQKVQDAKKIIPGLLTEEEEALVRQLEGSYNVSIGRGLALDDRDHIPWLDNNRAKIEWNFWKRYRRYQEEDKGMPEIVVQRLDQLTDDILTRLENPKREGAWDRRGMVVGQVQSGKTANYTGLICKAADAGYKVIIVLAGIHNSLRSQTQLRLDEGFLGFDTEKHRAYDDQGNILKGVGLLTGEKKLVAHSLTSCVDTGDFNRAVAKTVSFTIGGNDPVILVVKKNASVLRNLNKWATEQIHCEEDPITKQKFVPDIPILVIDDEADNASINTSNKTKANPAFLDGDGKPVEENDPTAINKLIRQLLNTFKKSAYVGYTATPFANIFIPHDEDTLGFGMDLFPRSFIISLPAPTNYVGPVQVFGLQEDTHAGIQSKEALPIVKLVKDYEAWLPPKHKATHLPGELPETLKRAIRSFILVSAARMARGQGGQHNSMLIHTTRYMDVQGRVTDQVKEELSWLRRRIEYGDGQSPDQIHNELRELWQTDFVPTSQTISQMQPDIEVTPWEEVEKQLFPAVARIQVKTINGSASDILDYHKTEGGQYVIAIGGDKLSRGLTLEGLSVSYYLRASTMYDTLMQMGRWFGYRPGYLDLCRLYTTPDLVSWYRHIALATEELRREFEYMAHIGSDPQQFGLRVRTHSAGMTITGVSKMRSGTTMKVSYAGDISETIVFHKDPEKIEANFNAVEELLSKRTPIKRKNSFFYEGLTGLEVIAFLRGFATHSESRRAKSNLLADYIEAQLKINELTDWSVALITNTDTKNRPGEKRIAGQEVGYTLRTEEKDSVDTPQYRIKRLLSPSDEALDLTEDQRKEVVKMTIELREAREEARAKAKAAEGVIVEGDDDPNAELDPKTGKKQTISGKAVRHVRAPEKGLLLLYALDPSEPKTGDTPIIGLGISFPQSENARQIEYKVNNVYYEQEYGEEAALV